MSEDQDDQPKDQSKQPVESEGRAFSREWVGDGSSAGPFPPLMSGSLSGSGAQFSRGHVRADKQRTQARLEKLTIADQMLSETTLFPDQHLILRTTLRDLGYDV